MQVRLIVTCYNLKSIFIFNTLQSKEPSPLKLLTSGSESSDALARRRKEKTAQNNRKSSVCSSSTERDSDETIRGPLFYSPKKTTLKAQTLENNSPKKQPVNELRKTRNSGNQGNSTASSAGSGLEQKENVSKLSFQEHEILSEDEVTVQVSPLKKGTSQLSVMGKNSPKNKKRKNYTKLQTESESESAEQTVPWVTSPVKRVLRSYRSKTNDLKSRSSKPYKFSDLDSEDLQPDILTKRSLKRNASKSNYSKTSESETILSSCDETSDNNGNTGKVRKTNSKKKNVEKRPVHNRVKELVRKTSTQSSEEDSDGASQKQSGKEPHHLRRAISPERNVETRNTSNHDRTVETGSKRKGKTQSDIEQVSSKQQALKLSRQTANKDSKRKQDVLSDEAPWADEEIKKLNEYVMQLFDC